MESPEFLPDRRPNEYERSSAARNSDVELREALAESGAVILEKGGTYSADINWDQFADLSEVNRRSMQELAKRSVAYLEKPILADALADQTARREWRSSLQDRYSPETIAFINSNRLRLNAIAPMLFVIPSLRRAISKEPETAQTRELLAILDRFLEQVHSPVAFEMQYRPISLDEKLSFARSFSDAARAYLSYVSRGTAELDKAA